MSKSSSKKQTEVQQLRKQWMSKLNTLAVLEDKNSEDQYTIEILTEHKRLLQLEKDRQPDEKMIAKKEEELRLDIEVDVKTLKQLKKSITKGKEDIQQLEESLVNQKKMLEKAMEDQDQVTAEMVANTNVNGIHPAELIRQIGKTEKNKEKMEKNTLLLEEEISHVSTILNEKRILYQQFYDDVESLKKMLKDSEVKNDSKEKERAMLTKNLNREKIRETELSQKREDLEVSLRALDQEKTACHDALSKKKRENEKCNKTLKKKELQIQWIKEQVEQQTEMFKKYENAVNTFPKDPQIEKETRDLMNEVEALKKKKMTEENNTANQKLQWEDLIETINKLSKEVEQERSICYEQGRMQHLKSDEREQKSREKQRAMNRLKQIEKDLASKCHELGDAKKRALELQTRQENSAKQYEQIKSDFGLWLSRHLNQSVLAMRLKEKILLQFLRRFLGRFLGQILGRFLG